MSEEIKPGYTRVSQILEMLPTFTQGKWGYPMQALDPYILARAADRGTNVHAAIEAHWRGEFYPLDEKEQGYFESFKKWLDITKAMHVKSEMRLYCDMTKLTGAIDLLASMGSSEKICIIDFKTTACEDKKKWPLQASFYRYLCDANSIRTTPISLFVKLDASGDAPICYSYDDLVSRKTAFEAFNLFRYLTNY